MELMKYKHILEELFKSQLLGVLATQSEGEPYTNLVAFTVTSDLSQIIFATPIKTKKYQNLTAGPHAAMLIDNRTNGIVDFKDAVAVTVEGQCHILSCEEKEHRIPLFLKKHSHMDAFVRAPSTVMVALQVSRYTLVDHFQHAIRIDVN